MKYSIIAIITFPAILLISTYSISNNPNHSVFIQNNQSISCVIENDKSFSNSFLFKIVDAIPKLRERIRIGEYILRRNASSYEFLNELLSGKKVKRKITFPEGITVQQILKKVNDNPLLIGEINEIPSEGSLFPDTYYYQFGDTKQSIIDKMKNKMNIVIKQVNKENITKLNTNEIIILASIIEKEVAENIERTLVSSVFHNRLSKKMRLQSCPTVKYALKLAGKDANETIVTKDDLKFQSPYNTYRNSGLPPTPICCPSKASIIAAMNPDKTNYLYFISDIYNKKTYFSETFDEHIKQKLRIKHKKNK